MKETLKHHEMVARLAKDGQEIISSLTPESANLWHMVAGLAGETGELLDAVLKPSVEPVLFDRVNLVEELGDIEFYLEGIRAPLGIVREVTSWPPLVSASPLLSAAKISVLGAEVLDQIKKMVIYLRELDREVLVSTMGRLEQYLQALRSFYSVTREETLEANIAKLKKRYEGLVYSDQQARDRADKKHETLSA
jgi:NTP pyrophosphatase (non-canonical NTP hydrolase)